MKPHNFEEKVIWYSILGTYVLYFLGAQFIFVPTIAWFLTLYLCKKLWNQTDNTPAEKKIYIPLTTWIWVISMLVMEFALIMAHIDWDLGNLKLVSSTVNFWARQWALLALFPLIACLNIRLKLLCRAVCILCLQHVVFILVSYAMAALHLELKYVSPLYFLGGNYDLLYGVDLYDFEVEGVGTTTVETTLPRIKLFAPWCPELGMVGNIYFFIAYHESNKKWRLFGMIVSTIIVISTISRAAILCLLSVIIINWFLINFTRPVIQITLGIASFIGGIFASQIIGYIQDFQNMFDSYRAGSSDERNLLFRMALNRWIDAPVWGNGTLEEFKNTPGIGTHHTWVGLLFVRGLVGLAAFAIPLGWSFMDLLYKARKSKTARGGLSIVLVLFIFGFVIDISYIAHLYWPGLIMMGLAFKEKVWTFRYTS